MILFWIIAVLLIIAALLFLLPPLLKKVPDASIDRDNLNVLLYKDQLAELKADVKSGVITQAEFDQAQQDLERGLLQDVSGDSSGSDGIFRGDAVGKRTAVAVVVLIPLITISLYLVRGAGELGLYPENATLAVQEKGQQSDIGKQILTLQAHLKEKPDNLEGWLVLARTQYYIKEFESSSEAFAQAMRLSNKTDLHLLADYADALAMANGGLMAGRPIELVNMALALQPDHQKALWLAATFAYQSKDYATTEKYWNTLLVQFPEGSPEYLQMLKNIGEARSLQGLPTDEIVAKLTSFKESSASPGSDSGSNSGSSSGSSSGLASISGEVKLDPMLTANISPTDTLFVFARAESGPRMPLAIIRTTASELPLKFTLDDSSSMSPQMKLSKFKKVVVVARISKSGDAMPQSGDLKGSTSVVSVGSNNLSIVINDVVGGNRPPPQTAAVKVAGNSARVSGTVDIDAGLKGRVSPTDTLYIFARAASGPRMPLAIIKSRVSALPFDFSLDDSLAMNPQMRLSNFKDVIVTARISKSGNALPQQGDLKGSTSVIKVGSEGLKIIIDSAVP